MVWLEISRNKKKIVLNHICTTYNDTLCGRERDSVLCNLQKARSFIRLADQERQNQRGKERKDFRRKEKKCEMDKVWAVRVWFRFLSNKWNEIESARCVYTLNYLHLHANGNIVFDQKKKEKKKEKQQQQGIKYTLHSARGSLTHSHNARSLLMVKTYLFWLARMWFLCFSFLFSLLFLFCLVLTSKCHNTSTLTTHGREGIVLINVFDLFWLRLCFLRIQFSFDLLEFGWQTDGHDTTKLIKMLILISNSSISSAINCKQVDA